MLAVIDGAGVDFLMARASKVPLLWRGQAHCPTSISQHQAEQESTADRPRLGVGAKKCSDDIKLSHFVAFCLELKGPANEGQNRRKLRDRSKIEQMARY